MGTTAPATLGDLARPGVQGASLRGIRAARWRRTPAAFVSTVAVILVLTLSQGDPRVAGAGDDAGRSHVLDLPAAVDSAPSREPARDSRAARLPTAGERETDGGRPIEPDAVPPPPAPAPTPIEVALIGDSLAWAAAPTFELLVGDSDRVAAVQSLTWGGTAPCDWFDVAASVADGGVDVAVIEFSGNALTPCMLDAAGASLAGAALVDAYEADTRRLTETLVAGGARVILAVPPVARDEASEGTRVALARTYRRVAEDIDGVTVAEAGAAVLADGRYTATLPCLAFETAAHGCRRGRIPVRNPADGLHFCPSPDRDAVGPGGRCPVWSSGAFRFGAAMARAALASAAAGSSAR